jgi:hypothetical protein
MIKHTAEQVEEVATTNEHPLPLRAREMLRAYAALLREREQAKQVVTDDEVKRIAEALSHNGWATGGSFEDDFVPDVRAALEAVWPAESSDD